jgi:hypothetical protein
MCLSRPRHYSATDSTDHPVDICALANTSEVRSSDIMSSPENIPLPSEGARGGKKGDKVTATCFCGQVQLLVARHLSQMTSGIVLTHALIAHQGTRPRQHCNMQLHRLPKDNRFDVLLPPHRSGFRNRPRPRSRQAYQVCTIEDNRERQHHGELFLLCMWNLDVSDLIRNAGCLDREDRDRR